MASNAERATALRLAGFTPRQARFLVLVLEHSGVCLPRQYRAFAGIAHGRQTHRFFDKLIAGGFALRLASNEVSLAQDEVVVWPGRPMGPVLGDFATTDLAAPGHVGRLYHVRHKRWCRVIGEPDQRHRRSMSVGPFDSLQSESSLRAGCVMVFDGVLAEPERIWLGLARDKAATATKAP